MNLTSLIDYFPFQYKERDTYKVDGKGILERFLEIFGNYLNEICIPDIDSALDNIDLDKTQEIYLNYLWEFLGELPFGYSYLIDKEKWDQYYNPFDDSDTYLKKQKLWGVVRSNPIILDTPAIRRLLKYAITLIKIRGTEKFFTTIMKVYGLKCTITDPIQSKYKDDFNGVCYTPDTSATTPKFDEDATSSDESPYDINYRVCSQCISVDVDLNDLYNEVAFDDDTNIPVKGSDGNRIYGHSDFIYIYGKALTTNDILQGVQDYLDGKLDTTNCKAMIVFHKTMKTFFDLYLPFNVTLGKLTIASKEITY